MSGELRHATVGGELDQAEWESIETHTLNNAIRGDLVRYDGTHLSRLGIGPVGSVLVSDGVDPVWDSSPSFAGDINLASGASINWAAGDVVITHSTNALAFTGATGGYSFDSGILAGGNSLFRPSSGVGYGIHIAPTNNGSQYGWQLASNFVTANSFTFTPSVAVGGSTYTTPVFTLLNTGALTIIGGLSAAGLTTNGDLAFTGASRRIIPGTTSFLIRNNADNASNVIITEAGAVTFRSTVGGITTLTATSLVGALTGNVTGNASTATALQTARNINGVAFDGSANITVTAAAGTLTGATLAANVLASSLTSVGTLGSLGVTGAVTAGSFVGPLTGNASTATILQTARLINGVSFDGSADITIASAPAAAAAETLTGTTIAANVTGSSLTSVGTLVGLSVAGNVFITDNNGLVIGHTAQVTTAGIPELQVLGTATADSAVGIGRWSVDASGGFLMFAKSRGATIGALGIVANSDELGEIRWLADDGTDVATPAASITAYVDGAPGANDMPGRLVFSTTADGANTVTNRMSIDKVGLVTIVANAVIGTGLTVSAGGLNVVGTLGTMALSTDGVNLTMNRAAGNYFYASNALGTLHLGVVSNASAISIATTGVVTLANGAVVTTGGLRVSAGNVGIGAAPIADRSLNISGANTTGVDQFGITNLPTLSGTTTSIGLHSQLLIAASTAVVDATSVHIHTPTIGGSAAVTNMYGIRVTNQGGAGITNAYGILISAQAGASATNVGLYNTGTTWLAADLYTTASAAGRFAGPTAFPSGGGPAAELGVNGGIAVLNGYNRTGAAYVGLALDGSTITFRTSGTDRMTLSSTGVLNTTPGVVHTVGGFRWMYLGASGATSTVYSGTTNWEIQNAAGAATLITVTNAGVVNIGTAEASSLSYTLGVFKTTDAIQIWRETTNNVEVFFGAYSTSGNSGRIGTATNHELGFFINNFQYFKLGTSGGLYASSVSGGDKGSGTVNAESLWDGGVQVTDAIFDLFHSGVLHPKDAVNPRWAGVKLLSIDETEAFTLEHRHLPSLPSREDWEKGGRSLGEMINALWEVVERQQIHIYELNKRLVGV